MMAALFLVMSLTLIFIYVGLRKTGMTVLIIGLALNLFMFWHHITEALKVRL